MNRKSLPGACGETPSGKVPNTAQRDGDLSAAGYHLPAGPGFFSNVANWLAGGVEVLDTIEYRFPRLAAQFPGNMMAFTRGGR